MELDQEVTSTQHAPKTSETTPIANDGVPEPSNASPVETETPKKRAVEHDSLVTVRLSEPPALHVNTAVPTSAPASRKSLYGHEDTPIDEAAEKPDQEEDGVSDNQEAKTPSSDSGLTLQQEIENIEDTEQEAEDGGSNSAADRSSIESEPVDWEELQKTENQESKDQDSDNVSFPRQNTLGAISC